MMITRATEDAIRLLTTLANSAGKRMKVADLAAATSVPKNYVFKVMVPLVRRGWVVSCRGFGGGFSLARGAEQITLLDVVELLEGPVRLNRCTGASGCEFLPGCPVRNAWLEGEAELRKVLARYDIARLATGCRERELFTPIAKFVPESNERDEVSSCPAEPSKQAL
jgi:Rrf2 family transcriptional regulator, iron-sulfur cluster assembly transcription factor